MTFYQGESLNIIFKAVDPKTGDLLNISDWGILVNIYTDRYNVKEYPITRISDSEFSVFLSSDDTKKMKPGTMSVKVTMTKETDTRIGTGIVGRLIDPLSSSSSCGCVPVDCGEVNATVAMDCQEFVFEMKMGNEIIIPGGDCLILLEQWKHDKTVIAEAITEQGVETDPTETGEQMAEKILSLQIAVPDDPSFVAPPANVVDLWNVMYNNQRAGYSGMYGVLMYPLGNPVVDLEGADAYLTSDGDFYTSGAQHTFINPAATNWVIYYFVNEAYTITIDASVVWLKSLFMYKGTVNSLSLFGANIIEVVSSKDCYIAKIDKRLNLNRLQFLSLENTTDTLEAASFCNGNNQLSYIYLPKVKIVANAATSAFINLTSLQAVSFDGLEEVIAASFLTGANSLLYANFPKLKSVTGSTFLSSSTLKKVSLPALETVASTNFIYTSSQIDTIEMPSLVTMTGSVLFGATPNLKYLFLPATPGGQIGNVWGNCSIEILELEQGFAKPLDITSLTLPTRDNIVNYILKRLGVVTTPTVLKLGATNYGKLTASDIQIATDKGWTVTV